jgi:hypothetical protein
MGEMALNRSRSAGDKAVAPDDRRRRRAAGCPIRRLSPMRRNGLGPATLALRVQFARHAGRGAWCGSGRGRRAPTAADLHPNCDRWCRRPPAGRGTRVRQRWLRRWTSDATGHGPSDSTRPAGRLSDTVVGEEICDVAMQVRERSGMSSEMSALLESRRSLAPGIRVRMSAFGLARHPKYGDRQGLIVARGSASSWRVKFDERKSIQTIHQDYLETV